MAGEGSWYLGSRLGGMSDRRAGHLLLPFLSWERSSPREELYHIIPNAGEADGKVWSCYPGQLGFDYPSSCLFYLDRSDKGAGVVQAEKGSACGRALVLQFFQAWYLTLAC